MIHFKTRSSIWILFFGIFLTSCLSAYVYWSVRREHMTRFESATRDIELRIESGIERYASAIAQARGLFTANGEVTRAQFHQYASNLDFQTKYPGLQGLGFALRIPKEKLRAHIGSVRASGFPDYKVWPEDKRSEYFSIIYLEPFDWRNQRAFGYDMSTEPTRRQAMERARDTGQVTVSQRVTLVQETETDVQPGFLIYVPVYDKKLPRRTVEQRRRALIGFVYSPFRATDFFRAIFSRPAEELHLDFEVFDGNSMSADTILYDHDHVFHFATDGRRPYLERLDSIPVDSHTWTIYFRTLPGFMPNYAVLAPWTVCIAGLVVTLLLFRIFENTRRDLIRRRRAEEALREAIRARDEFLSIASHELKTPLTSLRLQSDSMKRSVIKGDIRAFSPERITRLVEQVDRQMRRLTRLVDDMLDIARIRAGRLTISKEVFDLCDLVREVLERLSPQLMLTGNPPPLLACKGQSLGNWDRDRIDQVITNLMTNAIRYGRGKPIEVRVEQRGSFSRLEVQDHGIGIAQENQARIFNRFERAVSPTEISGLGLGLYITKQIVESHGGRIWVESELGQGATFIVELPAIAESRAVRSSAAG